MQSPTCEPGRADGVPFFSQRTVAEEFDLCGPSASHRRLYMASSPCRQNVLGCSGEFLTQSPYSEDLSKVMWNILKFRIHSADILFCESRVSMTLTLSNQPSLSKTI